MATFLKLLRINPFRAPLLNSVRNASLQTNTTKLSPMFASNIVNPWIIKKEDAVKLPYITNKNPITLPSGMLYIPQVEKIKNEIEAPSSNNSDNTIQAARLIVIRQRKMRKHKLRKLRKRMKFEWAKLRQRRELRKEKTFQAGLIKQCKEAEQFSAKNYVQERIDKLNEFIIPRFWKGKRLPEFIIREKLGLPPKK